jgi:uncharacterized protein YuzB (UPF0349 family)
MIKFFCNNHCADFEKDELEIITQGQSFTHCAFCGEKLHIQNLEEITETEIEKQVKNNIDKWFKTEGIERTIEIIEKHKEFAVTRLYEIELRKRGLVK